MGTFLPREYTEELEALQPGDTAVALEAAIGIDVLSDAGINFADLDVMSDTGIN